MLLSVPYAAWAAPENIAAVFSMLMAAGMSAQHRESKLSGDAEEAKEAWLDEKDPDKSSKLQIIWKEAEDWLERFHTQQVAGGEDPSQGCKI